MSFTLTDQLSPKDFNFFVQSTYQSSLDAGLVPEGQTFEAFREDMESYNQSKKNFTILVAKAENGEHAGFIWAANRGAGDELGLLQDLAWVYDLRVQPEFRRRGLGRMLLSQVEAWAVQKGYSHLGLHVFGDNHGAISLYESSGFFNFSCYLQKDLSDCSPSLQHQPFSLRQAATTQEIQRYKKLSLAHFAQLVRQHAPLSDESIASNHSTYLERFRFDPEKQHIFMAEDAKGKLVGGMWFYQSKGDLGDAKYLWAQEVLGNKLDLTIALTCYLEKWAAKHHLQSIRTPRMGSQAEIIADMQAIGYSPSNLFMHKKVYK